MMRFAGLPRMRLGRWPRCAQVHRPKWDSSVWCRFLAKCPPRNPDQHDQDRTIAVARRQQFRGDFIRFKFSEN